MKINFKEILEHIKEFWKKLSEKSKKLFFIISGTVLAIIVLVSLFSWYAKSQYRVIFPGMSDEEKAQVYATLQEMNVKAKVDLSGQVLVPQSEWDDLVFQLNAAGYPKTTLSYDTFTSSTGFTSTEFEKRTALLYQAQDRMQQTLLRQEGIAEATVTFTVPETSNYIWDQSQQKESTAGVTVLMKAGYELNPERVSAIKHLASTSVPNLSADNVVVVDAATGVEMVGLEDPASSGYYSVQRMDFERQVSKQIEDKIKRLLSSRYGADGVTAVATVAIDYSKMVSETKEYIDQNNSGSGVRNYLEEDYSLNGNVPVEGIVGEEDNTDAPPIYPNDDGTGDGSATNYHREIKYDVGYVLTQIEQGEPILQKASVAVIVDDPAFDAEVEEMLVGLISKAVNITSDNIRVTNLNFSQPGEEPVPNGWIFGQRTWLLIGLGCLILFLILVLIFVLLFRRAKKRRDREEEEALLQEEEERQRQLNLEKEIEDHKRQLQNEAMATAQTKENAITEEVRNFAKENPEIAAALLRSMMREEG